MPPLGKDDASGSCCTSSLPLNFSIFVVPSKKLSCFSAVPPVSGWNQCVKCVAPLLMAHDFTAMATAPAVVASIFSPLIMAWLTLLHTAGRSVARIRPRSKTRSLKRPETRFDGSRAGIGLREFRISNALNLRYAIGQCLGHKSNGVEGNKEI